MKFINKAIEKLLDINFYKLIFMISCFFYCIPLTNDFFTNAFKIFIVWGIIIFVYNYFYNDKFTLKKQDYLLAVFLALAFIGCLVNYKSNLITNIISVTYLFIQTILMVSYTKNKDVNCYIKSNKLIPIVIVLLTFISSIISLIIFLLNIKISYADGFQQILFGVFEGRLYGIQGNPNSLGQFALISIWMSIMIKLMSNKSSKKLNVFLCTNIFFQFICIMLSNSRSSILGLIASLFIYCIFNIANSYKQKNKKLSKVIFNNILIIGFKLIIISGLVFILAIFSKSIMLYSANSLNDFYFLY